MDGLHTAQFNCNHDVFLDLWNKTVADYFFPVLQNKWFNNININRIREL